MTAAVGLNRRGKQSFLLSFAELEKLGKGRLDLGGLERNQNFCKGLIMSEMPGRHNITLQGWDGGIAKLSLSLQSPGCFISNLAPYYCT